MHYKNPNLNLPTKNDHDRKSPLNIRPNLPGSALAQSNLIRNYSNTLSGGQKPTIEPQGQSNTQNPLNFQQPANPLKTTYVYQNGPQPSQPVPPPQMAFRNSNLQFNGQPNFKPVSQMGGQYNPLAQPALGQQAPNPQSTGNIPTISALSSKPNNFAQSEVIAQRPIADNFPKDNNLSTYSRGNTLNEGSRFHSNVNPMMARQSELNDNHSYHSKLSTNSRNHVLRAISVNNEDHLSNLANKEDTLKNQNILIANNFLQSIESSKRNVRRNMSDNFKTRVYEIWNSYLNEQLRSDPPPALDIGRLNADVENIKAVFIELLIARTDLYVEELKNGIVNDVFKEIDATNNQKQYLDNHVKDIVENSYNPVKAKNAELRDKLTESKKAYKSMIDQTVEKYDKLRAAHIDMYDREFAFKLNGDQNLVKNTLRNAIPFLQDRNKKADERLSQIRGKDSGAVEALQSQIRGLEAELQFYQKS